MLSKAGQACSVGMTVENRRATGWIVLRNRRRTLPLAVGPFRRCDNVPSLVATSPLRNNEDRVAMPLNECHHDAGAVLG